MRYSGTQQDNINKLEWQDAAQDMHDVDRESEVTYRYDGDFLYLKSYVPGLFCGVGSGARKQKPLKIAAMAFAYPLPPQSCEPEPGQETGNCGIDIKVFFVDLFREAIQVGNIFGKTFRVFPYRVRLGQIGKCQNVCVKSPPVVTKLRNLL